MAKYKVPTKVSLGGYVVDITYKDKIEDDIYGKCIGNKIDIALCKHSSKEELMQTVFHEMTHAVFWKTGIQALLEGLSDSAEEAVVVAIENHLGHAVKLDPNYWMEFTFVEIGGD
jgi:hypothetical protein